MRPGSGKALRLLDRADAQALVAAKRERLSQALLDLASLLATAQKQGWALVALDCALEGTTPAREALASVLASFAPCERRLISQRTREALRSVASWRECDAAPALHTYYTRAG